MFVCVHGCCFEMESMVINGTRSDLIDESSKKRWGGRRVHNLSVLICILLMSCSDEPVTQSNSLEATKAAEVALAETQDRKRRAAIEDEFRRALEERTTENLAAFLHKHPESQFSARCRDEINRLNELSMVEAWEAALVHDSIAAYEAFVERCAPVTDERVELARERIAELRRLEASRQADRRAADQAIASKAPPAIRAFLQEHPRSSHRLQVSAALLMSEAEEKVWELVRDGGKLDLSAYLRLFPDGRYSEQARNVASIVDQASAMDSVRATVRSSLEPEQPTFLMLGGNKAPWTVGLASCSTARKASSVRCLRS